MEFNKKKMQIELPETEIYAIALHIVNSIEFIETEELRINNQTVVDCVTAIIEDSLKTKIDRENINYARFVTHLCYLLKRIESEQNIISENSHLLSYLIKEYPEVYKTILTICDFFKNTFEYNLNDDEIVYLLIHVNRLYSRQDFK